MVVWTGYVSAREFLRNPDLRPYLRMAPGGSHGLTQYVETMWRLFLGRDSASGFEASIHSAARPHHTHRQSPIPDRLARGPFDGARLRPGAGRFAQRREGEKFPQMVR